jgi:hypothetical protein
MEYIYGDDTTRQGSVIVGEVPFMLDKEMVVGQVSNAQNGNHTCQKTIELALIFSLEVKDETSHPWDRTFPFSYIWECLVRENILNV